MGLRDKIADAAQELIDHLKIVEHIKALQTAQKEIADDMKLLDDRLRKIETSLAVIKSETIAESLKETQMIVNSALGTLNQRMENISIKLALLEAGHTSIDVATTPTAIANDDENLLEDGSGR